MSVARFYKIDFKTFSYLFEFKLELMQSLTEKYYLRQENSEIHHAHPEEAHSLALFGWSITHEPYRVQSL